MADENSVEVERWDYDSFSSAAQRVKTRCCSRSSLEKANKQGKKWTRSEGTDIRLKQWVGEAC